MDEYIKGKGILVGTFNEADCAMGIDKTKTALAKERTGLKYTNTEYVKKKGEIVGLRIYVCTVNDFKI